MIFLGKVKTPTKFWCILLHRTIVADGEEKRNEKYRKNQKIGLAFWKRLGYNVMVRD